MSNEPPSEKPVSEPASGGGGGLANALANALRQREKVIHTGKLGSIFFLFPRIFILLCSTDLFLLENL